MDHFVHSSGPFRMFLVDLSLSGGGGGSLEPTDPPVLAMALERAEHMPYPASFGR